MIEEYLGGFTWQIVEAGENVYFFVPDMIWCVKAILLVICCSMFLKGLFSLLRGVSKC